MAEMKLKEKYLRNKNGKSPKRTSAGNSGTRDRKKLRMPRNPAPLSAAGCRGWKPEYETPRRPKLP